VKHILSIAAIVSALASPAIAEDVPWAGLYVGASFDWGNGTRDITVPSAFNPRQNSDRFGYGATGILGYNWQSGPLIFGVEADAGWGNIQPRMTYLSKTTTEAIHIYTTYDYQASLRARIGYVLPWSVLGFVTGGGALVHSQSHIVETIGVGPNWGPAVADDNTAVWQLGWTYGAGLEKALGQNLSVRLEWQHIETGDYSFDYSTPSVQTTASMASDLGRLGMFWRF